MIDLNELEYHAHMLNEHFIKERLTVLQARVVMRHYMDFVTNQINKGELKHEMV